MLTQEQKATNFDTMLHIRQVVKYLNIFAKELLTRGEKHDLSKLASPEVEDFTRATPRLEHLVYGSQEYKDNLDDIKCALDHHYGCNRHHPQYHANGIDDMNLIDIMEMFADWSASCQRNKNGNLRNSLVVNAERFQMSPQLVKIFENTISLLEGEK